MALHGTVAEVAELGSASVPPRSAILDWYGAAIPAIQLPAPLRIYSIQW